MEDTYLRQEITPGKSSSENGQGVGPSRKARGFLRMCSSETSPELKIFMEVPYLEILPQNPMRSQGWVEGRRNLPRVSDTKQSLKCGFGSIWKKHEDMMLLQSSPVGDEGAGWASYTSSGAGWRLTLRVLLGLCFNRQNRFQQQHVSYNKRCGLASRARSFPEHPPKVWEVPVMEGQVLNRATAVWSLQGFSGLRKI